MAPALFICFFEIGSCYIVQAGLKHEIVLLSLLNTLFFIVPHFIDFSILYALQFQLLLSNEYI